MYSFLNDYNEIMHENIINALVKNNYVQDEGYGQDTFCTKAKELIKEKFDCKNSDIYFFMAGTQTNLTVIDYILRPYEAIISTDTAHINVHEVTAIEATGHKIITVPNKNGKLLPQDIKNICDVHMEDKHMALPRAVYISDTTELGTVYEKQELIEIYNMCKKYDLYLYVDGARLGSAICSRYNDIEVKDLAKYSDIFYIGGTKNGAMLGEALVINNDNLKSNFERQIKTRGAMYAKGRVIGIEFMELFRENLYFDLAKHSNKMAYKIYDKLKNKLEFTNVVQSNQIFINMKNTDIEKLEKEFVISRFEKIDDEKYTIRIVTSWATDENQVDRLIDFLGKME